MRSALALHSEHEQNTCNDDNSSLAITLTKPATQRSKMTTNTVCETYKKNRLPNSECQDNAMREQSDAVNKPPVSTSEGPRRNVQTQLRMTCEEKCQRAISASQISYHEDHTNKAQMLHYPPPNLFSTDNLVWKKNVCKLQHL